MHTDPAACGNKRIDNLATTGRMRSIWDRLAHMFPMVAAHAEAIFVARKDGRIRRMIERDSRFSILLDNPVDGPRNHAEWQLLAIAALSAINKEPVDGELVRHDGLWIGMTPNHPTLVARHTDCAHCATGWKPCPTQSYPMAHV